MGKRRKTEKPLASTAFVKQWTNEAGDVSTGIFGLLADGSEVCVIDYADETNPQADIDYAIRCGYFA